MPELKILRRKCDFCDDVHEFHIDGQYSQEEILNAAGWIILIRIFILENGQQQQPFTVQKFACKDSCAKNIIHMGILDLPQEVKDQVEAQRRQQEELKRKFNQRKFADHAYVPVQRKEDLSGIEYEACEHPDCELPPGAHPAGNA
jgi:hypothetical protein